LVQIAYARRPLARKNTRAGFAALGSEALGAPDWHGRSVGALVDTMIWHGEINAVSPPYIVAISNATSLHPEIRAEIGDLAQALRDARAEFSRSEGRDVDVQLDVI
jgi:hypothetical protein